MLYWKVADGPEPNPHLISSLCCLPATAVENRRWTVQTNQSPQTLESHDSSLWLAQSACSWS